MFYKLPMGWTYWDGCISCLQWQSPDIMFMGWQLELCRAWSIYNLTDTLSFHLSLYVGWHSLTGWGSVQVQVQPAMTILEFITSLHHLADAPEGIHLHTGPPWESNRALPTEPHGTVHHQCIMFGTTMQRLIINVKLYFIFTFLWVITTGVNEISSVGLKGSSSSCCIHFFWRSINCHLKSPAEEKSICRQAYCPQSDYSNVSPLCH